MRQQKDERPPAELRQPAVTLTLFIAAYIAGAGLAHWLIVRPSTGISTWPPGGLLVAALALVPRRSAAWWLAAAGVAHGFACRLRA